MSMTDRELALSLGMSLEALGRTKGATYALRDLVLRELGDSYISEDMHQLINDGFRDIEHHITSCFEAISGPVQFDMGKNTDDLP